MLEESMAAFARLKRNRETLEDQLPKMGEPQDVVAIILAISKELTALQQPAEIAKIIFSNVQQLGYTDLENNVQHVFDILNQFLWSGEKEVSLANAVLASLQLEDEEVA